MGRIEESRQRSLIWARWKNAGGRDGADREAIEWDHLVSRLPEVLRRTLHEVHLRPGGMPDHVRSLGCPESTISRRLGRADRLLLDALEETRTSTPSADRVRSAHSPSPRE